MKKIREILKELLEKEKWDIISKIEYKKDSINNYDHTYYIYKKKNINNL